jgi:hypothetical protein
MSVITLRELAADTALGENTKGSLLTSLEIDTNFHFLNEKKIDVDGSIPMQGDLVLQGNLVSSNNSITISAGGTGTVTIDGNLNITGEQQSESDIVTTSLKQILANNTTSASLADTAGLEIRGDSLWASILFDASNNRWVSDIDFSATDFELTGSGEKLSNLTSLRSFVGASDSFTTNYSSTNYVTSGEDLETSVSNLDAQLGLNTSAINNNVSSLKTYTGGDLGSTDYQTEYTEANTVSSGDSLEKGIDDLDINSKYTITSHESRTSTFVAESGVEYRVTPPANNLIDLTLPATQKGVVSVVLTDASNGRYIRVWGSNNESIENNVDGTGNGIPGTIKTENQFFLFRWDELSNTWRIR